MSRLIKTSVLLCALSGSVSSACTIPVFRYALDRWQPDAFQLVVPADMATSPLLTPLRGNAPANIRIENGMDGSQKEAVLFDSHNSSKPLWSGPLNAESLQGVLDSPARQELLKHLLEGDSVIWVIADGSKPEDDAEAARIEKRLRYLQQVVDLPPQDPNDPDSQLGPGPPLKLKFTVMRVSQNNSAEKLLCAMLAGSKAADALAKGEPFAAAVFGRGRVLGAWPLSNLDDTALEDITLFLTGRCSCRVKNQSPGWDVLLKVDWEAALRKAKDSIATDTTVAETKPALQPVTVTTVSKMEPVVVVSGFSWRRLAALCLPAIVLASWLMARTMKR